MSWSAPTYFQPRSPRRPKAYAHEAAAADQPSVVRSMLVFAAEGDCQSHASLPHHSLLNGMNSFITSSVAGAFASRAAPSGVATCATQRSTPEKNWRHGGPYSATWFETTGGASPSAWFAGSIK